MVWYYADGDRQRGPISDEEFQEMVNRGRINTETLVWKDGMDDWQPLQNASEAGLITISPVFAGDNSSSVGPSVPWNADGNVPPPPPGSAINETSGRQPVAKGYCCQCGRGPLTGFDLVRVGNLEVCRGCNESMAQHYRSAGAAAVGPWPATAQNGGATRAGELLYASIAQRFGAVVIDNVVASVAVNIALMALNLQPSTPPTFEQMIADPESMMAMLMPSLIASLIFSFLYNAVLVTFFSATLGKMAFRIRVSQSDGSRVLAWQAIVRAALPPLLLIPTLMFPGSLLGLVSVLIYMGGFAIALFDGQRRTLYDHLASTRVVRN